MASTAQNVSFFSGETVTINVAVTSGGVALNLTGYEIKYVLDTPTPITKTVGSGITVTDAAGGLFTITLTPANTDGVTGAFSHGCKTESTGGVVSQVFVGTASIIDPIVDTI